MLLTLGGRGSPSQTGGKVVAGRAARADGWLEHCEVQLLNGRALHLAAEDKNAGAQSLAITRALQDLEHARSDLLAGKPRLAQQDMDAAVPLISGRA
jgi:hypothetical protein